MSHHQPKLRALLRSAAVREILAAAEALLREGGGQGFSMGQVAQRAGCAVGTLYRYFPSKETLLEALVGSVVRSHMGQESGSAGNAASARLWRYLCQCAAWGRANAKWLRAIDRGLSDVRSQGCRRGTSIRQILGSEEMPLQQILNDVQCLDAIDLQARSAVAAALLEVLIHESALEPCQERQDQMMRVAWVAILAITGRGAVQQDAEGHHGTVRGEALGQRAGAR